MLTLSETPHGLLDAISSSIAEIRDVRARHWLILPGKGRSEYVLHQWARRTGIATHTQEVQLRELLDQTSAGGKARFDFERLRLAIAAALSAFETVPGFPIPPSISTQNLSGAVLDWATSLAKGMDDALTCRPTETRWKEGSFFPALMRHPLVSAALERHNALVTEEQFAAAATEWMEAWKAKGGVPHLWIQLDAGLPFMQFERLLQLVTILRKHHPERLHLFALSPSSEYWGEARVRIRRNPETESDPALHPGGLLWAFGRCSQDLHRQLAGTFLAEGEGGSFVKVASPGENLLGRLQLSCRRSAPLEPHELRPLEPDDASVTVHSARTTLRELEICRDRILQARLEMPDLRYEEILILLADPKRQAPFVEAALRHEEGEHRNLPHRLLGLGQTVPSPLSEGLLLILEKLRGRMGLDDLQTLMESPLISAKFHFAEAHEDGLDLLSWIQGAQFRWGLDSSHRAEFQPITPAPEHRWNLLWALQRLGLGALVSQDNQANLLSLPGKTNPTIALERASGLGLSSLAQLAKFATALNAARQTWSANHARSMSEWNGLLLSLTQTFLLCEEGRALEHFAKLQTEVLPSLLRAAGPVPLSLSPDAYIRLVQEKLAGISESGARGSGGICVADLRQYAGVPARLILIAGLNDTVFPRRDDRPQWHPLVECRKTGDPSLRDADRHALLLAILSCRERLVLSYQGGTDSDPKERPPSTALADVLQAIDQVMAPSADAATAPHKAVLFSHALNGNSPEAFRSGLNPSQRNMLRSDFEAAQMLQLGTERAAYPGLWQAPLASAKAAPIAQLRMGDLRKLFTEPARILLAHAGVHLPEEEPELEDGDMLEPNSLENWTIRDQVLQTHLEGKDTSETLNRLMAAGRIPRGEIGSKTCSKILEEMPEQPSPPLSQDERAQRSIRVGLRDGDSPSDCILEGPLKPGWYLPADGGNALFFSASAKDLKNQLLFCLDALALAALPTTDSSAPALSVAEAQFRTGDKNHITFRLPDPARATELLGELLPLYELATRLPLPLWPKSTSAILNHLVKTGANPTPEQIQSALNSGAQPWFEGSFSTSGSASSPESESPSTRYAFRGCPNPFEWQPWLPELPWLPEPGQPLAWRLIRFLQTWLKATSFPVQP